MSFFLPEMIIDDVRAFGKLLERGFGFFTRL